MDAIQYHQAPRHRVNIKSGALLQVVRVYIRKDQTLFNSVTLFGQVCHLGAMRKVRFWVSLEDFNKLEAEVIND